MANPTSNNRLYDISTDRNSEQNSRIIFYK